MARKSSRRSSRASAPARTASTRKKTAAGSASDGSDEGGMGVESGIIIATTLVLVVAFVLLDKYAGGKLDGGLIF